MTDNDKKCSPLNKMSILPSWECCACESINGDYRAVCKKCKHERCFFPEIVIEATDEIILPPIETDPKTLN